MTGTLHEELYTFMIISCLVLCRREIFQPKVVEKMKTRTLNIHFYRKSCR